MCHPGLFQYSGYCPSLRKLHAWIISLSVNNMKRRKPLTATLLLLTDMAYSSDYLERAGQDYRIDPDLLHSISRKESSYRVNAIGMNPVTGFGSGLMQVDSRHFNELNNYGIKPERMRTDPCINIYTDAYYLAISFKCWTICRCI